MSDRYDSRGPPRRSPGPYRGPPRNRDDHPDVAYFGAGESYRPGGAPSDGLSYRPGPRPRYDDGPRGPPPDRRDDRRREDIDSYIPPTSSRARNRSRTPPSYRRRSRSPPPRGRPELFPDKGTRSPPRRFSPPRDRPRSPVPPRYRSRSPFSNRARSPPGRRSPLRDLRDLRDSRDSPRRPFDDRPRSPPRRPLSPPRANTYRPRSRTPPGRRDDRRPTFAEEAWRRRSPSPRASGQISQATSRRSSPPPFERRSALGSRGHSPIHRPVATQDHRENSYRAPPRSPPDIYDERAAPSPRGDRPVQPAAPPTGPRSTSHSLVQEVRPLPAASSKSIPPPPAPQSTIGSASVPDRPSLPTSDSSTNFTAPSGPRASTNIPPKPYTYTDPYSSARDTGTLKGRTSLTYRAPGYQASAPTGPRMSGGSALGRGRGSAYADSDMPYRASAGRGEGSYSRTAYPAAGSATMTSASTTTPTSMASPSIPIGPSSTSTQPAELFRATPQTFIQRHLSSLEQIIPGGRKYPALSAYTPEQEKRIDILADEAEKLRITMMDRQKKMREAMHEWADREREVELAGLRSELAEESLRRWQEEEIVGRVAAF